MTGDHPDPLLLERFMRNETEARERRAIIRHLLAGCPQCSVITSRLWGFGEERPVPAANAGALDPSPYAQVFEAVLRRLGDLQGADEAEREPALAAPACHRLALQLAETGRGQDALTPLRRARALYERLEDGPNLARLRHLEGRILQELDSPAEAEAALQEGMLELLREGLGAEAARALLDLALLYTRQGRAGDVQRLAASFYPICRVRGVGLEVVTSLLYFRRLVETGHATPEVLFQVARFLADPPRAQRPALG
jgi:tetratricopeptide (TPR) repeat protein